MVTVNSGVRLSRLAKVFKEVINGQRPINTAADARQFLEAARTNPKNPPAVCLEILVAKETVSDAIRSSLRMDASADFLRQHVLPFIAFFNDPAATSLFGGQPFQKLLTIIAHPPLLWSNLFEAYQESQFVEDDLRVFAWLCLELASLPGDDYNAITDDISSALQRGPLKDANDPLTRDLTYRINKVLSLKSSKTPAKDYEAAGGRHDNDFANFREISIFPTSDEFHSNAPPFYRRASEVAAVEPAQRARIHIDNQFRLLREDMLAELRDDLKTATGKKKSKKIAQIFGGLTFVGIDTGDELRGRCCSMLVSCRVGLGFLKNMTETERRNYLNENKAIASHQSFGVLCGEEHVVAFAFISRNIDKLVLKPPVLDLQFPSSDAFGKALLALQSQSNLRFILVNTPVFAYQPVLECLQETMEIPLIGDLLRLKSDSTAGPRSSVSLQPTVENHIKQLQRSLNSDGESFCLGSQIFRLDHSQLESLLNALQSPISLIQGPPGTGKSFIGALAAKILLDDTETRLLVLSYTNHALDQFLTELVQIGIPSANMTRLGSKSSLATALLSFEQQYQASTYRQNMAPYYNTINTIKENMAELRIEIDKGLERFISGNVSSEDIVSSLEFIDAEFHEAFRLPEQAHDFQLSGKGGKIAKSDYLYDRWARGLHAGPLRQAVPASSRHIWQMPLPERTKRIETWTRFLRDEQVESIQELVGKFDEGQRQVNSLYNEAKCSFIQTKRLIGCTTTGAAKYKSLIRAAKPDVVLVEEAGEILEAHVLTALNITTRQLILIGDHKQLRPKINNYSLSVEKGEGFDLNRSLFERLIAEEHEHTTLQTQHRMHPQISELVRRMTYPDLIDDEKTYSRAPLKGLQHRVSFVNHEEPEDLATEIVDRRDIGLTSSKKNQFEAQMVLKLVKYLAQQGYSTMDMVVLTPYLGQLRLLRDMIADEAEHDPLLNDLDNFEMIRAGLSTKAAAKVSPGPGSGRLRLSTIDNYQGEESDIVIASLTRSNKKGDIGFMKEPERLNVLCSRARNCLIMIGNMDTFMESHQGDTIWMSFFSLLKDKAMLKDGVSVRCQQHPERSALLASPDDFESKCPDGGCVKPCDAMLACGIHKCPRRCHRLADHSKVTCDLKIEKTCDRGHTFSVKCTDREATCRSCLEEDQEMRRRMKRDLQMVRDRDIAQRRYKQQLQMVQDEIDRERRLLKYAQEEEDEKKTLQQQYADLKALRETRQRAEAIRKASEERKVPGAFPKVEEQETSPPPAPGSAEDEWDSMKEDLKASNSALDTLMGMIGLESVKQEFLDIKNKVDTAVRQDISLEKERFSCTLLGNPGTGKTTVARIYSKFLTSVGVIAGSCFKETSGSKLAAMGVSGCKQLLDDVQEDGGGVIFIDEAYQLSSGNSPGGRAVLDFLLAEVENLTGKIVFILAGYNKQMESFFAHNPGFPSRFPIEMKFDDYSDEELLRILKYQVKMKYGGRMKWEDELYLRVACRRLGRGRGKEGFGNARAIENLLGAISSRQANRLRKQRKAGKKPDDLLLTKEDLVGPEPANALISCKAWRKLQDLTGLSAVKEAVKALVDSIQTNYHRELAEEPVIEYTLNKVFLGSPGTGKTTVAKLYAQILVDLGLLSNGEVVVKRPADFVGAALGGSEAQTKGILAATVGKVLVIDEAYGLYGGGGGSGGGTSDPYKTAVVDTIVAEVQSVPGEDRCVLLLGYKDQMEEMFQNVNPGLSRRFPLASAFNFEDFSNADLQKILDYKLKEQGFKATDQAKKVAMEMLDRARNRPNFGNAGEVDIILNDAKAVHQRRLSSKKTSQVSTLEALDFDENFDRGERTDTNVAKLFEGTVGCEMIVAKLEGFQQAVRSMKELGMDPKENIPFNFLFRGPPGTGKTSTARKMGKVFYDMGFLANADVIDCSATDLIGQYVGQTGPKVQQLLDKALGRVLFVDEAYRLAEGHFAKEAVDEIVDCVTKDKYKGRLVIILAGYDNDINRLLNINPGMSSRFPEVIDFHSLSPENCFDLLFQLLKKQKLKLESKKSTNKVLLDCLENPKLDFRKEIISIFRDLSKQASWASARDVESLAKAIFNEALKARKDACITITEAIVESELDKMFYERENRNRRASTLPDLFQGLQMAPPPSAPPPPRVTTQQAIATAEAEEEAYTPEGSSSEDNGDETSIRMAVRDAGVSDEVWEQLERDKKAQEEKAAKYKAMLKAKKEAQGAARERILKELIEEEERRKREEEQRKKAAMMGRCPMGYDWIKQASGFRCAGGSHFISNEQIAAA